MKCLKAKLQVIVKIRITTKLFLYKQNNYRNTNLFIIIMIQITSAIAKTMPPVAILARTAEKK